MIKWILAAVLMTVVLTLGTSCASKDDKVNTGLVENKLRACPSSPNCVCSEHSKANSAIAPVSFSDDPQPSWTRAVKTVQDMGGKLIIEEMYYLHASFTSRIFRFVDDFELRLDVAQNVIHMRSASRTGYSDLGVNRKRSEQFRKLFSENQQ